MTPSSTSGNSYVKTQTLIFVGIGLFLAGYLVGVGHTIYRNMPQAESSGGPHAGHNHPVDRDRMETALIEATQKNPQNVKAWIQLGNIYFDRENYPRAIEAYNKALAIEPQQADVLTDLGVMYRRNKQPEKAVEAFDKAIAVDPRHEMSRFNKGIVLMHDLNDPEGAVKAWEALNEINPGYTTPNGMALAELIKEYKK